MGNAEFKRVFQASPATRRAEWANVILHSFLVFLVLGVTSLFIAELGLNINLFRRTAWWLPVAGVPFGISLIVGYLRSRSWCQFVLALEETQLQAGSFRMTYEDVAQINLSLKNLASSTAIEITGRRKCVVRIDASEHAECALLLRQRCRNAIFVDATDHLRAPAAAADRTSVAKSAAWVAVARMRTRARELVYIAIILGVFAASNICWLLAGKTSGFNDLAAILEGVAGATLSAWQARDYFKKAHRIEEALTHMETHGRERMEA